MRINSIKISNISSYIGECYFDFRLDKDKSLILIGGQNGTGKTSLFTALKLALYGHLSFNYQSINGQYLAKIKELINHDAFTSAFVRAFIEVEIEIPDEREYVKYLIRREWTYTDNRIVENLIVEKNGEELTENQMLFFGNYLHTILPPNLFDFYFFDGEQIADFFSTSSYNSYIKNAVLTLCNYDTFEIIRKFCDGYISNNDILEDPHGIASSYEAIVAELDKLQEGQLNLEQKINDLEGELSSIAIKRAELENQFKNSGGLTESEKDAVLKESREHENKKSEYTIALKNFVEGRMPLIISASFASEISEQLIKEEEVKNYLTLKEKLDSTLISSVILNSMKSKGISIDQNAISELTSSISDAIKPNIDIGSFVFLHDLSKEQKERVAGMLNLVSEFEASTVLELIDEKEKATQKTIEINKQLREAMSDIDTESYSQEFNKLTNDYYELQKIYDLSLAEKDYNKEKIETIEREQKIQYEKLKEYTRNKNVYELTHKISKSLDAMIHYLTTNMLHQIETEILSMLKKIMRKDSFIDLVELDDNFNISIYKEQTYQYDELENLIRNAGQEELIKRIGTKGVNQVLTVFGIDSITKLKNSLKKYDGQLRISEQKSIKLYKKIELGQLSKGEKQIFILSLYYAIIKVSGKDIPFIIDTPYARIDTDHREQISREFFPVVSHQVIILSTDQEVTKPYYDVLKPFISKEYLLQYDEVESRTIVTDGYFFEG